MTARFEGGFGTAAASFRRRRETIPGVMAEPRLTQQTAGVPGLVLLISRDSPRSPEFPRRCTRLKQKHHGRFAQAMKDEPRIANGCYDAASSSSPHEERKPPEGHDMV
jgi:hypothetical protein